MAAMEDEGDDLDPKDVKYMEGPIEDQIEVGEAWAEWHMARDDVQLAEKDADEAKQRNKEREYAKGVEKQKRADDKKDAEDKAQKEKEDRAKSLAVRLETGVGGLGDPE